MFSHETWRFRFIFIKVNLFKLFLPKQSGLLCLFHECLSIFRKSQLLKGLNHYDSIRRKEHCIRSTTIRECCFSQKISQYPFIWTKIQEFSVNGNILWKRFTILTTNLYWTIHIQLRSSQLYCVTLRFDTLNLCSFITIGRYTYSFPIINNVDFKIFFIRLFQLRFN